ncbi:hypothetical protein [Pseudogulbenkiania sp. MAI-1]|uniref:hypothetical protein n=1 Tax=Pseudogulbenkiania sp. MAI-1 TaxID=990370 RepID=UPI00045E8EA1|nr:hypothetical protein [Pseudogulbenkiania sp. MAI-1]
MKLTLIVPGLSWLDAHDGAEVLKGLSLPALATLLGRACIGTAPPTLSELTAQSFGLTRLAPARQDALADGLDAAAGHWLIADPVHVRVDRDRALLADVGVMNLAQHEADALVESLNRHFAEDGMTFFAPQPGRWYVRLRDASGASFTPLMDAVGENINEHLPGGANGLTWSRWLNEMQMLLYTHPVNDQREAQGEVSVNSVWLWGEDDTAVTPRMRADRLFSDDATWQGLARQAGQETSDVPFAFSGLSEALEGGGTTLVHLDRLLAPAQYRDAWGWRDAITQLEADWFSPLLAALKSGRISELTLLTHGPAGFSANVTRSDLWKFWRRARPLTSLYPAE